MDRRLLECAVRGHDLPDQKGEAFQYQFSVTTRVIGPHDIPTRETTKLAECCARCDLIVPTGEKQ